MAQILEIYEKYKIMPGLQLHQLRVAAVAKQICDSLTTEVDEDAVIKACLLHDIANIIKFDLDTPLFPELLKEKAIDYWKKVQQDYKSKYGPDEHQASVEIGRELGMSEKVLDYIESVDFKKAEMNVARAEIEPKICDYSDLRANPHGIVSVKERLEEGAQRYKNRIDKWIGEDETERIHAACYEEENQIFAKSRIKPTDITNESIAPLIEQLKTYEI